MKNFFDKIDLDNSDDNSEQVGESDKTDIVKRIELIDTHNLSQEDVDFMLTTIQDSLKTDAYIDEELVERIPAHMTLLPGDEFTAKLMELDKGKTTEDAEDLTGFYNEELEQIFINQDFYDTPDRLFATMLHESLHYVSMQAGAGYGGYFSYSVDIGDNPDTIATIKNGVDTLVEGTTQEITWNKMRQMGFEDKEDYGYIPKIRVMQTIYSFLSEDEKMKLYYQVPMEGIRVRLDELFGGEQGSTLLNCLYNIGVAAENMEIALDFEDKDGEEELKEDIKRSMTYFFEGLNKEDNV